MQSLVTTVREHVGDQRVHEVRLEVGELTCVTSHALHFCFDACVRGTPLDGARLEIISIPAETRCSACTRTARWQGGWLPCACGSTDVRLVQGQQVRLKDVEVS